MKQSATLIALLISVNGLAQVKTEVEKRIDSKDVPQKAIRWLNDAYEKVDKVKWYYEETTGKASYEAKLKWNNRNHSVEFNTKGVIEDIEIYMDWDELPDYVRRNVIHYMDSAFTKYNIRKIQQQWTGEPDDLEDAIDEHETEDITTRYEIEFYGKNENHNELWEGLFDHMGILIEQRIIKLLPTDNLNY
ncbi:MAG: hypothetical protein GVY19_07045 [Bacteroidetes bacterium]|jgi:hypothetical protein|nr:hypothetical protein [Bacteroidota bacterium]